MGASRPCAKWGEGGGVVLLALPAFLPSLISSYFTQNRGGEDPMLIDLFRTRKCLSILHYRPL